MRISSISYVLACLLICLVESSSARLGGRVCNPSSCGDLHNIAYPFRLQTDPAECGDNKYELICDEQNRTVLDLGSGVYYISEMSYEKKTIQITDAGLASGGCNLPAGSQSPDHDVVYDDLLDGYDADIFRLDSFTWATFVNCTRELNLQREVLVGYCPIPCLNSHNSWVYAMNSPYLDHLAPPCKFLAMVPTIVVDQWPDSQAEAFKLLQKGFIIHWSEPRQLAHLPAGLGGPTNQHHLLPGSRDCNPSSCGDLHNIIYPFRLQTDPAECGDKKYELICDEQNRTVFNFSWGKYYISEMSYEKKTIQITDAGLESGGYSLPAGHLSPDVLDYNDDGYYLKDSSKILYFAVDLRWAAFVNCTWELDLLNGYDVGYCPIPYLSRDNSWVYALNSPYLDHLPPPCKFLATVPTNFVGQCRIRKQRLSSSCRRGSL